MTIIEFAKSIFSFHQPDSPAKIAPPVVASRGMIGFLGRLSEEQKAEIIAYRGGDTVGDKADIANQSASLQLR